MLKGKGIRKIIGISVLMVALFSGACASGKPPVAKIADVENAISRAKENIAESFAPLELKFAEDKLTEAKIFIEKEEYLSADRLLDEALMDAKLAEARSRSEQKKAEVAAIRENIETLRKEIEFKSQAR